MLFCHFTRADSLREISNGLACCLGKLNHLGLRKAPLKFTLAYANSNRTAELYEELFYSSLSAFRERKMLGVRKPFKFRKKLAKRVGIDRAPVELMAAIDEIYTAHPFKGARRISRDLADRGMKAGRAARGSAD